MTIETDRLHRTYRSTTSIRQIISIIKTINSGLKLPRDEVHYDYYINHINEIADVISSHYSEIDPKKCMYKMNMFAKSVSIIQDDMDLFFKVKDELKPEDFKLPEPKKWEDIIEALDKGVEKFDKYKSPLRNSFLIFEKLIRNGIFFKSYSEYYKLTKDDVLNMDLDEDVKRQIIKHSANRKSDYLICKVNGEKYKGVSSRLVKYLIDNLGLSRHVNNSYNIFKKENDGVSDDPSPSPQESSS